MKRNISCILLTVLMSMLLTLSALADVIYEPDDAFYRSHAEECVPFERAVIAGENGADILTKPGGQVKGHIDAGEAFYADYRYDGTNGEIWGCVSYRDEKDKWCVGWVQMNGFELVTDGSSFDPSAAGNYYDLDEGEVVTVKLWEAPVLLWAYPGAANPEGTIDYYVTEDGSEPEGSDEMLLYFRSIFEDENGEKWSYLGYWQGWRDAWVCVSDPSAETHPVREPVREFLPEAESVGGASAASGSLPWLTIAVAAIVAGSAGGVLAARKQKK